MTRPGTRRFTWHGIDACLQTNVPDLANRVALFLSLPGVVLPTTDTLLPDTEHLVTASNTGAGYRIRGDGWHLETDDADQMLFMVLEGLGHIFLTTGSATVLHAGAIKGPAGACIFYGAPHAGKTTLAYTAWREGHQVIGDDRVRLSADHQSIEPFPKCLKLRIDPDNPPGAGVPGELQARGAMTPDDHRLILARELEGFSPYDESTPIATLVHLERAGHTAIETLPPDEALTTMLENIASDDADTMAIVRLIKRQSERGRLFRLTVAPDESKAAVNALLAAGANNK